MPHEINLTEIGKRIEALRGRLSQSDFAASLGVDRKTVGTWERGERLLDTKALLGLWAEFDADPAWILTGGGFAPTSTEDERELISLFREASLAVKAAAIGALQGGSAQSTPPKPAAVKTKIKKQKNYNAPLGQAAGKIINKGS
ncbi:helix-turn-helix domain-containing protein [Rhodocyclus gracilis]|uniref:HTH cro/C1-type domain-containing protein n=1 Tax=Rhodocyclus tenuis TaxID=1066 RepID=A0A6L5JVC0_RHOTE|nr:helix-turn-helix domain-containing protein [Rhodocyclus gracilis]MQY50762.1 hypothetical protein [Rhodocyclus gracilis]